MKEPLRKPLANYAEDVKNAISTIIIQATEYRNTEEVEQQVLNHYKEHQVNVKSVRKIRNGVKLICKNAKDALDLKKIITENYHASDTFNIRNTSLRKKIIIIFNVPRWIPENQVSDKIARILGISRNEFNEAVIKLMRPIEEKKDKNRIIFNLLEALADYRLKKRRVCLGYKVQRVPHKVLRNNSEMPSLPQLSSCSSMMFTQREMR